MYWMIIFKEVERFLVIVEFNRVSMLFKRGFFK